MFAGDSLPGKSKKMVFSREFCGGLSKWVIGVDWCQYLSLKYEHFQLKYRPQPMHLYGECAV